MTLLHRLASVLRWLLHRDRAEQDLNDELQAFVDMAAADKMREGVPPAEARRLAVLHLGGVEQAKERVRTGRYGAMLESLNQDLRLACRGLLRAKAFTTAAVLTLALGIAGTTAMFALINGVLLRPLPVREQDRLIVAWKELQSSGFAHYEFGNTEIEAIAEASRLLERAAGVTRNRVGRSVVIENGVSSYVNVALVTGAFFDVLGIQPMLGRTFTPADDVDGAENVLVISHGLWQRRYGASREAIGRRVMLGEQSFTIVGVMPPDLDYPRGVEIWRTTSSVPTTGPFGDAARREVDLIARLRPGVTIGQVTGELASLTERLDAAAPPNVPRGLS